MNILTFSNAKGFQSIADGNIVLIKNLESTENLVDSTKNLVKSIVGNDWRNSHKVHDADTLFEKIGRVRKEMFTSKFYHSAALQVVLEASDMLNDKRSKAQISFDPVRLRVVTPGGHNNPAAAAVYLPHRDTWYSHPANSLAFWTPLHDVKEQETFEFYEKRFGNSVDNNSSIFDYGTWTSSNWDKKIGWQNKKDGLLNQYPSSEEPSCEPTHFSAEKADLLLFSASHLHKTKEHDEKRTRFSLDWRVSIKGIKNSPLTDNFSTGDAAVDYIKGSDL